MEKTTQATISLRQASFDCWKIRIGLTPIVSVHSLIHSLTPELSSYGNLARNEGKERKIIGKKRKGEMVSTKES